MSQDEIKAWLQENPGWHVGKEIVGVDGMRAETVYYGLRRLRKNDGVEYKAGSHGIWFYRALEARP